MIDRPILVVDDDPAILATVAEILDLEGTRWRSLAMAATR